MNLSEKISNYIGGQLEIRNSEEKFLYRGQISDIALSNNKLYFWFSWMAKGEDYPVPKRWVEDYRENYSLTLSVYNVSDVGDGRTILDSPLVGETLVLFPKDGKKLDKSKVEGLEDNFL